MDRTAPTTAYEPFPLSAAQHGLWFAQQLAPDVPICIAQYLDIRGALDVALFRDVAMRAAHEFQSVFLRIVDVDGTPHQVVDPPVDAAMGFHDLRAEPDPLTAAQAWMHANYTSPVDIDRDLLCESTLLRVGDEHYLWYSRIHHIALDGHGAATMVGRVASLYTAAAEGSVPEPNRAADLRTLEQLDRDYRASHRFAADRDYWAQRCGTRTDGATLATRDAPPVATSRTVRTALSERSAARLADADHAAATLVAAFAHYLSRRTGRREVTVDVPVSARPTAILRRSGGMLANVAPVRVRTRPGDTVGDLVGRVQGELVGALRHQRGNVEDILRDLGADAAARAVTGPMVNVMLFDRHLRFGALSVDFHILTAGPVPDLAVNVYRSGTAVVVEFAANPDRYGDDDLRANHDAVVALVEVMLTADAGTRLSDLESGHRTVVHGTDPMPEITLPHLLADAVAANPGGVALAAPDRTVTYAELDAASNLLAGLLRVAGVHRESIVAVALTRSVESVTAVWAVAKTGAAFVPVDPNHPAGRIEHMIADSEVAVGVTVSATRHRLPGSVHWLVLDEPADTMPADAMPADAMPADAMPADTMPADTMPGDTVSDPPIAPVPVRRDQAAYVIYTSGSTGLPKGVVVTHHGLANLVAEQRTRTGVNRDARVLHCASPSFDASVFEMLWAAGSAATLVVVPQTIYGGDELTGLLRRESVTHAALTPSVLASLEPAGLDALRTLLVAGEACAPELVERWAPGRTMLDGYGPTESTVMANLSDPLAPGEPVTIGGPARGFSEVVLDAALRPVPAGVAGELYLGGPALARGYRGRASLTASRFVADPFGEPGARLYRTGDVVRWRNIGDGTATLDYVGRSDFQVKIRGIRVELGEIDAALARHSAVDFAVTVGHRGPAGGTVLVSYVLPAAAESDATVEPDPDALREHLRDLVPTHMIPAAIVVLDELPLTPVGKLDRAALPVPHRARAEYRAPVTGTERAVAGAFAEVLGLDLAGLDDNFFDLGGNSLSATRVVARINTATAAHLGVRDVFEAPTVAMLAARVAAAGRPTADRPALVAGPRPQHVPLALAQQRMWVINQLDPTSPAYNIPIALRLTGDLDVDALRAALADVLDRHESLRTVHPSSPQGPQQVVLPVGAVDIDLAPISVTGDTEMRERVRGVAGAGFDVRVDVPMRTALFRTAPDEHVVAIVLHHIAADGFSTSALARDVMLAYTTRAQGLVPRWAPLSAHYADYALWQRTVLGDDSDPDSLANAQIDFWRRNLDGLPGLLALPTDRDRTVPRSAHGATVPFAIGAPLHRALSELARAHEATMFMVVHAVLAVLLGKLSGTADLAIGTPVAGRGDAALDDMVGMFVNTVALRARITPQSTFGDLVAQVRADDLAAFDHADVPFDHVVRALDPLRSAAHAPLFQVLLEFRNLAETRLDLPGLAVDTVDVDLAVAKCDLYLSVDETRDGSGALSGLNAEFGFTTDIFDKSTVDGFACRFVRLLDAVVAEPTRPVGDIDLLDALERAELVPVSGGAPAPAATLPELFAAAVAADPDAVAVVAGAQRLTYRELDRQSNRLARILVRAGVGPESTVAIAMPRSAESVLAVWAVAKAGAAFLPVDPNYPAARINHMIADSTVTIGMTTSGVRDALPGTVPWLNVDEPCEQASIDRVTATDRVRPLRAEHPAYVIYTSGSTGVPKGVEVTHAGLANLVAEQSTRFGLGPHARVLHAASPSFDAAVLEMLWAFGAGGRLVISPPGVFGGRDLADLLARERVTHAALTPAALGTVDPAGLDELGTVIVGGENCPPELVARWAPGRTMVNTYGPAEATIQSNAGRPLAVGEPVTIGGPIRGFDERVLDERMRPVPVGVVGELYLSGPALARGYRNRPGLSAARFVAAPGGNRMYRTGDLARWRRRADGTLELDYAGRSDQQVKVRGFRIELGEIESALLGYPGIAHAVAHPHGDRLAGYVVATPGVVIDTDAVLGHARTRLAPHMVPATVTVLDRIPVTANGKLDRASLPHPEATRVVYRAPRDPAEAIVADAFAGDLRLDRVGSDDNYFALGGTSLSATAVIETISDRVERRIPVQWIFTDPTPEALARRIATTPATDVDDALAPLLPLRPNGTGTPVFCVHPAIGLAWCFTGLVPYLGDRPVYGLQSPSLTDPHTRFGSLTDLADRYIEQIRSVHPRGPYHLVGYSVGGQIAHEMAVRLGAESVASLTMLDSHLLGDNDIRIEPPTLGELLAEFGDLPTDDTLTAEHAADILRRTGGLFDTVTPERVEALHRVFAETVERALAHRPESALDADILYFAAAESAGDPTAAAAWAPFVGGWIDEHPVSATHQQLTGPHAVDAIGPVLARYLRDRDTAVSRG